MVAAELALLFDPDVDPERGRLDGTIRLFQRMAQLRIAQQELPEVARAVEDSYADGANRSSAARQFVSEINEYRAAGPLPLEKVPGLLRRCDVGREAIGDEVGHDLMTATASTVAAVGVTALGGGRSGVAILRPAMVSVRAVVMTAYLVAQNAVRRSKSAFALTQLLLVFAVGVLAVKVLGGEVRTPLVLVAIPVLAAWMLITALTIGAWGSALLLVPTTVVVGWTFLDECDAIEAFGGPRRCPPDLSPPDWRERVVWIVPLAAAVVAALIVGFYAWRWVKYRRMRPTTPTGWRRCCERAQAAARASCRTTRPTSTAPCTAASSAAFVRTVTQLHQPLRRARRSTVVAFVIGVLTTALLWVAGDYLLLGGERKRLISATSTLHDWRPLVYLVGIPIVLITLSLLRLAMTRLQRPLSAQSDVRRSLAQIGDRVDDRLANTAILWYRWTQLPRVKGTVDALAGPVSRRVSRPAGEPGGLPAHRSVPAASRAAARLRDPGPHRRQRQAGGPHAHPPLAAWSPGAQAGTLRTARRVAPSCVTDVVR